MRGHLITTACVLAVAACGENGPPEFTVQGTITVESPVAPYSCTFRWEGVASDSTTPVDVMLLEIFSNGHIVIVPVDTNVYQRTFSGSTQIDWTSEPHQAPPEMVAVRWLVRKYGTTLIADDTARFQDWPTCRLS